MRTQAVRIIKFDAGHRVVNHESKCRTLHGHEYKAEIFAESDSLDSLGRVIDFGVIKKVIGSWIDEYLDHNMILFNQDPDLHLIEQCSGLKKTFVVPFNPTAENLSRFIYETGNDLLLGSGVKITKIKLWETSNCYVEYYKC